MTGVDWCRGRWLAATVDGCDVTWALSADIGAVFASDAVVGIDIPIGLPESGARACDIEARARVGARRSSVFPAPARCVLTVSSYADARRVLAERGGPSMSAQAFGIVRAIKSVDDVLTPARDTHVVETHPEVSFAAMRGSELTPKKTAAGVAQRMAALSDWIDVFSAVERAPVGVPIDDALDALACAWSAHRFARGEATVLGDGQCDSRGLPMRIVV